MIKPTAANILSSLGVKGAIGKIPSGERGSAFSGFLPVLNENGKVDLSFIPAGAAELSVTRLYNVAIVDPETTETVRTGSIISPFKTVEEAAASITPDEGSDTAARCAIVLMPGKYYDMYVEFSSSPGDVYIVCVGQCSFMQSVSFSGIRSGGTLTFQNVSTSGVFSVAGCSKVVCVGNVKVTGSMVLASGAHLALSADSYVASTNAATVSYLSDTSRVSNTSSVIGATAKDALNRLGARSIRVADITEGSPELNYDNDRYVDISAESSGGMDVYDLRMREKVLVDGINDLAVKMKNPVSETVTADRVVANDIGASSVKTETLSIGDHVIAVDAYGYLVVSDGDDADSGSSS